MASSVLLLGLVDDASMFPPGGAAAAEAVVAHLGYRRSWFASLVGPLVVSDQRLTEVGRALRQAAGAGVGAQVVGAQVVGAQVVGAQVVGAQVVGAQGLDAQGGAEVVAVSVVNSGGAGGLVSLAGRETPGISIVAVESALRDLDDLAGNASRVVSAAAELDDGVDVFVEVPFAPGWERAVEAVEAAGLLGKIRTGGPEAADTPSAAQLARQLSVLIEADLAFKATAGLHHAWPTPGTDLARPRQHGFLNLLTAVDALVEGASERDAADLLLRGEPGGRVDSVGGWGDERAARVRRRFRSFGCCGVLDPVHELVSLGLLSHESSAEALPLLLPAEDDLSHDQAAPMPP